MPVSAGNGPASPRGLLRLGRERGEAEGPASPQAGIARALQRTKYRSLRHQVTSQPPLSMVCNCWTVSCAAQWHCVCAHSCLFSRLCIHH